MYVEERWPLIVDATDQAGRYLRYQRGSFLVAESREDMAQEHLRKLLVGALKHGSQMTLRCMTFQGRDLSDLFTPNFFPVEVLQRSTLFSDDTISSLLRPDAGDPPFKEFIARDDFRLIVVTPDPFVPPEVKKVKKTSVFCYFLPPSQLHLSRPSYHPLVFQRDSPEWVN